MEKKIEITKFKITIFMTIMASVGFLIVNFEKIVKNAGFKTSLWISIIIMLIYGLIGFIKNMIKLSKIKRKIMISGASALVIGFFWGIFLAYIMIKKNIDLPIF